MVDIWTLIAFIPAGLALNLSPGADMMFCLGLGLRSGPRAAIAASAGISTGGMVHVALAGLGLGAVVAAVPWVFDAIRWIGVAYLLWLAYGALRMRPAAVDTPPVPTSAAFREGMLVNLTNPKVILFVLAFVPQFVDPAHAILPQFLIFGLVLAVGGFFINGAVGVFAGGLGRRLTGSPKFAQRLGWASAAIFIALAARLAVLQRS